jgi:hypothetical protein
MPIHELKPGFNRAEFLGETLSNTLKETFHNIAEKKKEERHLSSLEKGLKEAESSLTNPNLSPEQKHIRLHQALRKHPEAAQRLSDQLFKREEFTQKAIGKENEANSKKEQNKQILRDLEKRRKLEEGELDPYVNDPRLAESLTRPQSEKPVPQTQFEKTYQTDLAKQYKEDQTQTAKSRDALKNISRMENLSKKLTGVTGYGKALIGSSDASEFDALGLASIEPVLKIFNPVGAIPTQKINLIKDKFSPKATDRQPIIEGKLRALKAFNEQALARAQERMSLIDQHKGNPPPQELEKFDQETETLADAMLDYNITQQAQEVNKTSFNSLPDPAQFKGKSMLNKETGQKVKSDGEKWNPI